MTFTSIPPQKCCAGRSRLSKRFTRWLAVVTPFLLLISVSSPPAVAQPSADGTVPVTLEFKNSAASRTKCGFPEYIPSTPPRYYLSRTTVETASGASYDSSLLDFDLLFGAITLVPGTFTFSSTATWMPGADACARYKRYEPGWPFALVYGQAPWCQSQPGTVSDSPQTYDCGTGFRAVYSVYGVQSATVTVQFQPDGAHTTATRTETYDDNTCMVSVTGNGLFTCADCLNGFGSTNATQLVRVNTPGWTPGTLTATLCNEYSSAALYSRTLADLGVCEHSSWGTKQVFQRANGTCLPSTAENLGYRSEDVV